MALFLRERWNLSQWAIAHPRLTISFWLGILVAGILAFSSLKYALFPDVAFPVVIVQATAPLASAQETEQSLTNLLEAPLKNLPQTTLYSSSYPGQAVISIAFNDGSNLAQATQVVETALKPVRFGNEVRVKTLPFDLNESVAVTYAVTNAEGENPLSLEQLQTLIQRKLLPPLEQIPGVLRVNLLGDGDFRIDSNSLPGVNPPTLTRHNSQDVLALQVIKDAGANTLDLVQAVERLMAEQQQALPQIQLIQAETQADFIQEATTATLEALFGAIILAILVIFPFLRSWRATLISAIAIPLSLLGTAIILAMFGLNLETLTLLALALVIGIVVDDAIVDVENIARHIQAGKPPKEAARLATDEIGLSVTATTFSIVVVFLPIAFLSGTLGQFFRPFALTVSAAVLFSLLVARTLSPVLAIFWLRPQKESRFSVFLQGLERLTNGYEKLLHWALGHRRWVMAIAVGSLVLGLAIIPFIPQGLIPVLDRGEFNVVFQSAQPQRIATTLSPPSNGSFENEKTGAFSWMNDLAASPESFLLRRSRRLAEKLEPILLENAQVASVFTIAGVQGNPLKGNIYVKLKGDRQVTTQAVQTQVRGALPTLPKVTTRVENIPFVQTGDDTPIKLALMGTDLEQLKTTAETLKTKLMTVPGLIQVTLSGNQASGAEIEHFQGQRAVYLSANLAPDQALGDLTQRVMAIATGVIPPTINLKLQGESARLGPVFTEFGLAILLSLGMMAAIFLGLFKRLLEPLVILLSLPLAIVGAMLGLLVTQSEFGIISLMGLIFLLGLLNKNAVLLVDYANQLREQGYDRQEALLETGRVRFRPILMTTASTILGMLPLALGLGAGAELRQPMAIAIIGGLTTSLLLSLLVVPVLYTLLEDLGFSHGTLAEKPKIK